MSPQTSSHPEDRLTIDRQLDALGGQSEDGQERGSTVVVSLYFLDPTYRTPPLKSHDAILHTIGPGSIPSPTCSALGATIAWDGTIIRLPTIHRSTRRASTFSNATSW